MIEIRKANERGTARFSWLDSKHTFSFGHYYDPNHMGFSALRVINDDIVTPSAGFDTHGHRDMEIISYVLEGNIEHKDSKGNVTTLSAGEFQLMSAGQGILHSEYNQSATEHLRFLQIWIQPNVLGGPAGYQQKKFGLNEGITTIITPTGEAETLRIKQQAKLHQLVLSQNAELEFQPTSSNVYIHIVEGKLNINDAQLSSSDGAKITNTNRLLFANNSNEQITALIFELP